MKSSNTVLLCCVSVWFCCAIVECHGHLLDADGKVLKEGNSSDEDRLENGVITATNIHEDLLLKSHPEGILNYARHEDAIKISDDVCESEFPKCTDTGGRCYGKAVTGNDNSTTQCVCPGKSTYEAGKGCTVPDQVCQSDFPNCTETGGSCDVKVEEESEKSAVQCECPDKSVYKASEGCTVSDEVCKTYFPKCIDTGGKCNVEVGNEHEQSIVQCECPKKSGYKEFEGCKACMCGFGATGCSFVGDFQTCKCSQNFFPLDDMCVDCHCGKNSTGCTFNKRLDKFCKCDAKFAQKGSICAECDCGDYNFGCKFEKGEKKCDCVGGYVQKDGVCIDKNQTKSGLSASVIAAIVVGTLVAVALVAAAVFYYLKYYKQS